MKFLFVVMLLILSSMLASCDRGGDPHSVPVVTVAANSSSLLKFVEFEKDVEPYATRLIVTPEYLRFDDGEGSKDFIILDRNKEIIYSINSDERTVMSIGYKENDVKPPFELKLEHKKLDDMQDAPEIVGRKPQHYQFSVNEQHCYEVVVINDLMPDVVKALQAFTRILASDSKHTFNTMPADMHDACDMAMMTFAAGAHFRFGFPVQEWSSKGSGRSLVDFEEDYKADPGLFILPADYRHYALQDFREGKVKLAE